MGLTEGKAGWLLQAGGFHKGWLSDCRDTGNEILKGTHSRYIHRVPTFSDRSVDEQKPLSLLGPPGRAGLSARFREVD